MATSRGGGTGPAMAGPTFAAPKCNFGVFFGDVTRARRLGPSSTFFLTLILPYHVPVHMSRTRVDTYVHSTPAHAAPVHHTRRKRRIHADYFFGI